MNGYGHRNNGPHTSFRGGFNAGYTPRFQNLDTRRPSVQNGNSSSLSTSTGPADFSIDSFPPLPSRPTWQQQLHQSAPAVPTYLGLHSGRGRFNGPGQRTQAPSAVRPDSPGSSISSMASNSHLNQGGRPISARGAARRGHGRRNTGTSTTSSHIPVPAKSRPGSPPTTPAKSVDQSTNSTTSAETSPIIPERGEVKAKNPNQTSTNNKAQDFLDSFLVHPASLLHSSLPPNLTSDSTVKHDHEVSYHNPLREIENELRQTREELRHAREELEQMQGTLANAREDLSNAWKENVNHQAQIANILRMKEDSELELGDKSARLDSLNAAYAEADEERRVLREQLDAVLDESNTHQCHVQSLQSIQASLASQLEQSRELAVSLKAEASENAAHQLELARLRRELEELITSRAQLVENIQNTKHDLENTIAEWDNAKEQLSGAREELSDMAQTYEETRRELEISSRELALSTAQVNSLEDQLEQSSRDNDAMEERIYELEEENEVLRTETQNSSSKNEAVLMVLGELEIELHKARIDATNAHAMGNKLHEVVVEAQTEKAKVLKTVDEVRSTIRELLGEMVAKLKEMEAEHAQEREESQTQINALEQQLKVQTEAHISTIEALKDDFATEKNQLIAQTKASEAVHNEELDALKAQADLNIDALRKSHWQEIEDLQTTHDLEVKALQGNEKDDHPLIENDVEGDLTSSAENATGTHADVHVSGVELVISPPQEESQENSPSSPADNNAATSDAQKEVTADASAEEKDATLIDEALLDKAAPIDNCLAEKGEPSQKNEAEVVAEDETKARDESVNGTQVKPQATDKIPTADSDQLEKKSLAVSRHKSKRSKILRGMVEPIRRVFSHRGEGKSTPTEEKEKV